MCEETLLKFSQLQLRVKNIQFFEKIKDDQSCLTCTNGSALPMCLPHLKVAGTNAMGMFVAADLYLQLQTCILPRQRPYFCSSTIGRKFLQRQNQLCSDRTASCSLYRQIFAAAKEQTRYFDATGANFLSFAAAKTRSERCAPPQWVFAPFDLTVGVCAPP